MLTMSHLLKHSLKSCRHFGRTARMVYPHSLKDRAVTGAPSLTANACLMTNFFPSEDTFAILPYKCRDSRYNLFSKCHRLYSCADTESL
jgi:hypothetical protein